MYWKMSTDLSKPLVPSEGGLDSFSGLVVYRLLQQYADSSECLSAEIDKFSTMVAARRNYRTSDFLGVGQALWLSHWFPDEQWARQLRLACDELLPRLWHSLDSNDRYRLAFRELGFTIGMQACANLGFVAEDCKRILKRTGPPGSGGRFSSSSPL